MFSTIAALTLYVLSPMLPFVQSVHGGIVGFGWVLHQHGIDLKGLW